MLSSSHKERAVLPSFSPNKSSPSLITFILAIILTVGECKDWWQIFKEFILVNQVSGVSVASQNFGCFNEMFRWRKMLRINMCKSRKDGVHQWDSCVKFAFCDYSEFSYIRHVRFWSKNGIVIDFNESVHVWLLLWRRIRSFVVWIGCFKSFLKDFSTLCSAVVIDYWLEFIMIQQISAVFTRLENQEGEVRLIAEVSQHWCALCNAQMEDLSWNQIFGCWSHHCCSWTSSLNKDIVQWSTFSLRHSLQWCRSVTVIFI